MAEDFFLGYLDQNVFSRLQDGEAAQERLLAFREASTRRNIALVYSAIHVEECRGSDRPEVFVNILEGLSAQFLEKPGATDTTFTLTSNRARELILADTNFEDETTRVMNTLLSVMQFYLGWLGEVETEDLHNELIEEISRYWQRLENEFPYALPTSLLHGKNQLLESIKSLPLDSIRDDSQEMQKRFRERLPKNYAQLDDIPANEAANYLISRIEDPVQRKINSDFPPHFWSKAEDRKEGSLAGFAFMLFALGLIRDPRTKRKDRNHRQQHFLGQFRDCQHIEEASRCDAFVTFDRGAARLAKAAYAYAGVRTQVIHLERLKI